MEEDQKILAKVIIEILGAPEKHVQETLEKVVEKVKAVKEITVTKDKIFETKQMEDKKMWSTFAEIEMKVKHIDILMGFCFDFMPSSIEILEPTKFKLNNEPVSNLLNDLISRLHQYDMLLKNLHAENIMLKQKLEKHEPKQES